MVPIRARMRVIIYDLPGSHLSGRMVSNDGRNGLANRSDVGKHHILVAKKSRFSSN